MALYPPAVKKLIAPGVNDPRIKARVVILHVAATEAGSLFNYFNGPSGGIESHFYVTGTGGVEQYRDTAFQADANKDANDFAISIETQGLAAGEWTPQQLASLRALIRWCHDVHGIPIVRCATWDGSGVGYHSQFTHWAGDGRTCPGPDRIKQIPALIASAAGTAAPAKPAPTPATPIPQEVPDMQPNDVVPGTNPPITWKDVAVYAIRGNEALKRVVEGGWIDKRLDVVESSIGSLRAAIEADDKAQAQAILDRIEVSLAVKPDPPA